MYIIPTLFTLFTLSLFHSRVTLIRENDHDDEQCPTRRDRHDASDEQLFPSRMFFNLRVFKHQSLVYKFRERDRTRERKHDERDL